MSTGLHREPPITYDSSFDRTKNKLATLKVYDAKGNSQEWKMNYPDNIEGYKEAVKDYIQEHYCDAGDAREIMQTYIRSDACKKPHSITSKDHALRINRLIRYSDKLQGHGPKLSKIIKTTMLLQTFPNLWVEQYGQTKCTAASPQKHPSKRLRPGNNANNSKHKDNTAKHQGQKSSNPCCIPGHNHDWSECPNY
eukprot:jgi/Psemu1/38804/gm1.38804_g